MTFDETRIQPIVGPSSVRPHALTPPPELVRIAAANIASADRQAFGLPVEVQCSAIEPCESCTVLVELANAADPVAPDGDLPRLQSARRMARHSGLHGDASMRLVWAAHYLTGPVLARVAASRGYRVEPDEADLLVNYVRFCREPWGRCQMIVDALVDGDPWRPLYDILVACSTGSRPAMLSSATEAMRRIGAVDSVYGSMMVDLVVGALLPPPIPN